VHSTPFYCYRVSRVSEVDAIQTPAAASAERAVIFVFPRFEQRCDPRRAPRRAWEAQQRRSIGFGSRRRRTGIIRSESPPLMSGSRPCAKRRRRIVGLAPAAVARENALSAMI
jgi:hypothetical protein